MAKAALAVLGVIRSAHVRLPLVESPPSTSRSCARAFVDQVFCSHPTPSFLPRRAGAQHPESRRARRLGEVGRNMTVLERDGRLLVIDCGVLFPDARTPGSTSSSPTWRMSRTGSAISRRSSSPRARGTTSARCPTCCVVSRTSRSSAPAHLALVEAKPKEHRIKPYTLVVSEGSGSAGHFDVEFSPSTTRSPTRWPSSSAPRPAPAAHRGLQDGPGCPLDGRLTDLRAFGRIGAEGVDLFPHRLHQCRRAGLHRSRRRSPRRSTRSSGMPSGGSSSRTSPAHPPCPAGPRRRRQGGRKSPSSAGPWSAI